MNKVCEKTGRRDKCAVHCTSVSSRPAYDLRAFRHCGIGALFHRLSSSAPQNHLTSGQTLEQKQAEKAAKPSQAACSPRGWVGDAVEGRRDDEGGGADPHHDVEVVVRLLERRGVHVHIRRRRLHTLRATSSELRSTARRIHPRPARECGWYLEDLREDTGSEYGGDGEPGVAHCKRRLRILLAVPATPTSAHQLRSGRCSKLLSS